MTPRFTAGVLLYGDHPDLARRVLTPLLPHAREGRITLMVAASEVSAATAEFALPAVAAAGGGYAPQANIGKYPTMRTMVVAADTDHFMWFDDDSYIPPDHAASFFDRAEVAMAGRDLIGSRYRIPLRPGQREWIARQPWYAATPLGPRHEREVVGFFTGGWWCARAARLREWDYPWPELHHNGGDVMLGVLASQQGWCTAAVDLGVAINADAHGRESRAPRRGMSTLPIGATS